MARIKVTGYLDTDELAATGVGIDLNHKMGLTTEGFDTLCSQFMDVMDDVDFELVKG